MVCSKDFKISVPYLRKRLPTDVTRIMLLGFVVYPFEVIFQRRLKEVDLVAFTTFENTRLTRFQILLPRIE